MCDTRNEVREMTNEDIDFEVLLEAGRNDYGTYLKVPKMSGPIDNDAFIVLYLRPQWQFLMLGYWQGYELSKAMGQWSRSESNITLHGAGIVNSDCQNTDWRPYDRGFVIEKVNFTPTLTARGICKDWSLLSWEGPFNYVGETTIIDPDGEWMPKSIADVDKWIENQRSTD
jgi:hypothetical protein